MITYQFDECFDDPEVIEACNEEKKAVARHIDDNLRGKKDPEVLAVLMYRPTPMVTTDGKLPRKHSAHIPDINPGIIVVAYSRYGDRSKECLKTVTTTAAGKLLRAFKDRCPTWDQLIVQNSIVEITNKEVLVSHVEKGQVRFDLHIPYGNDAQLQADLKAALFKNAQRNYLTESTPSDHTQ